MTNPVSGGFQFTPATGLNDAAAYPSTPVSEAAARQQFMDMYWQLMNEMNKPTLSAAAFAQYNRLINGGFSINQRVKSGTITLTAGQYGHDRWKAGSGGCTYTFATVANVTTITITVGSLVQVIEGINLTSGTHTLSWTGTAQGKIGAGGYSASGVTGTATGGTDLSIEFNAGTLSKVQFNAGDQALPFQPRSFADELALCQRYYEKSYNYSAFAGSTDSNNYGLIGIAGNTDFIQSNIKFKVIKRTITPTFTLFHSDGTSGAVGRTILDTKVTGVASSRVGDNGVGFLQKTATFTAGDTIYAHWTCDAEL